MHRVISVQTRSYPTLVPPPPSVGAPWGVFFHPGYRQDVVGLPCELWVMPITQGAMGDVVGDPELYWTAPSGRLITCMFYSTLSGAGRIYVCLYDWASGAGGEIYAFGEGEMPSFVGGSPGSVTQAAEFGGMIYLASGHSSPYLSADVVRLDLRSGERVAVQSARKESSLARGGLAVQGSTLYWSSGEEIFASSDGAAWTRIYANPGPVPWYYGAVGLYPEPRQLGAFCSDEATGRVHFGGTMTLHSPSAYTGWGFSVAELPAIWGLEGGAIVEEWRGEARFNDTGGMVYQTGAINALRYLDPSSTGGSRLGPYGHNETTMDSLGSPDGQGSLIVATPTGLVGEIPTSLGALGVPGQGMASYGGSLYALLSMVDGEYVATLARFDGTGWGAVRRFIGYRPDTTGCICVPNTGYLCHEV